MKTLSELEAIIVRNQREVDRLKKIWGIPDEKEPEKKKSWLSLIIEKLFS